MVVWQRALFRPPLLLLLELGEGALSDWGKEEKEMIGETLYLYDAGPFPTIITGVVRETFGQTGGERTAGSGAADYRIRPGC